MNIRTDRMWDLSQPIAHDGPAWVEFDPPVITHNYRRAAEGFNAETVHLNTHTGTHVDVPFHFDDNGASIEQMPSPGWRRSSICAPRFAPASRSGARNWIPYSISSRPATLRSSPPGGDSDAPQPRSSSRTGPTSTAAVRRPCSSGK